MIYASDMFNDLAIFFHGVTSGSIHFILCLLYSPYTHQVEVSQDTFALLYDLWSCTFLSSHVARDQEQWAVGVSPEATPPVAITWPYTEVTGTHQRLSCETQTTFTVSICLYIWNVPWRERQRTHWVWWHPQVSWKSGGDFRRDWERFDPRGGTAW